MYICTCTCIYVHCTCIYVHCTVLTCTREHKYGNIEPTTRHFLTFFDIFSSAPHVLCIHFNLDLLDNVLHDWLFPYQMVMITSFSLTWWLLKWEQLWPWQFCVSGWNKIIIIIISLVWLYFWSIFSWFLMGFWWHAYISLV